MVELVDTPDLRSDAVRCAGSTPAPGTKNNENYMKTLTYFSVTIAILLILFIASPAKSATWFVGGVLYGNVCRSGAFFYVYPPQMAQPVGSVCPLRDGFGNIYAWGTVSAE